MIVSKFSKSYDTSNGSEQPRQDGATPSTGSGQTAAERWADDGGPSLDINPPRALTVKPAWSVLSLKGLLEAIRRAESADDPENERQRRERAVREDAADAARVDARRADAAHAWHDRNRNAWEHT